MKEHQNMNANKPLAPFSIGDVVVPKFTPIDPETRGGKEITDKSERLTVTVIKYSRFGENYFLHFSGISSRYDAGFFKKIN
jgi:hypothetical protein